MRIVIDSDSYEAIAAYRWPCKIGYVNGHTSAWSREQIADCAARGELLALIDVLGTAPHQASVLDWERGDVQNPDVLREWVQARNKFRGDATIYCNRSSLTTVINALQSERAWLWLAEPSPNSEPPRQPPPLGLPPNLQLLGIQYALEPESGGHYDISIFYADQWHASSVHREDEPELAEGTLEPRAGVDQAAELAEAAAEDLVLSDGSEPVIHSAWPASDVNPDTPASMADTVQSPNPFPGVPSALTAGSAATLTAGSAATHDFLTASPRPVPAHALGSSADRVSAPSSAASPSTPPSGFFVPPGLLQRPPADIAGPGANAQPAPATSPTASTGPTAVSVTASADPAEAEQLLAAAAVVPGPVMIAEAVPATPAAPAPATGPPASQLPHGRIQRILADVRDVALQFRSVGQHQPARMLEEAAAAAAEAGSLLQRAGLLGWPRDSYHAHSAQR